MRCLFYLQKNFLKKDPNYLGVQWAVLPLAVFQVILVSGTYYEKVLDPKKSGVPKVA